MMSSNYSLQYVVLLFLSFLRISLMCDLMINTRVNATYDEVHATSDQTIYSNATRSISKSRSAIPKLALNSIDQCWMGNVNWAKHRMKLGNCAIGFGSDTRGGQGGKYYIVNDPSDDATNPTIGTLRYGVTRLEPLWIYFAYDMNIKLKNELIITSDKTIDGRGRNVHIGNGGPCLTLQFVNNVIVHGLHIHDCTVGEKGMVMSSSKHIGYRKGSDGDGITIFGSTNIWIDHNFLSSCFDGLIDVTHASTAITISNNLFTNHDKVMLMGHNDGFVADKVMQVTVIFNNFGPGLVQRMPRCRFGLFHVINNYYYEWGLYAIGGSADPTIISEGNKFVAGSEKQVTKREGHELNWSRWLWKSKDDTFLNGAYFVESGTHNGHYHLGASSKFVDIMVANAGPTPCIVGRLC